MNSMKSMSFFLFLMKKGFSGVCLYFTFQHKATITKATFIFLRTESISFRHRIFIVNISKNKMKVIFFFFSRKKSFFFFFLVFVLVCSRSFAVALHNYFAFCSLYIESATLISPLLRQFDVYTVVFFPRSLDWRRDLLFNFFGQSVILLDFTGKSYLLGLLIEKFYHDLEKNRYSLSKRKLSVTI